jgi:hypothetical protein
VKETKGGQDFTGNDEKFNESTAGARLLVNRENTNHFYQGG